MNYHLKVLWALTMLSLGLGGTALRASTAADPVAYATTPDAMYMAEARFEPGMGEGAADFQALNPWQQFHVAMFDDTVTLAPYATAAPPWTWSMQLAAFGGSGEVEPAPGAPPRLEDAGIEFDRGPIIEWYRNSPRGISQRMVILERPPGTANNLIIRLRIASELQSESYGRGRSLRFVDANGTPRLHFGDVWVLDSGGRSPRATLRFDVATSTAEIVISLEFASFPLRVDANVFTQQRLVAGDEEEVNINEYRVNYFGYDVASSGHTLAVGAPHQEFYFEPESGESGPAWPGAVYVFEKDAEGRWTERQKLTATPLAGEDLRLDWFGNAVAMDGDTMVVAAPRTDLEEAGEGVAYIFERENGLWMQRARLRSPDLNPGAGFGDAVAISGNTVVVMSRFDRIPEAPGAWGSAAVFERTPSGWEYRTKLAPTLVPFGNGTTSSIAVDGDTIVLGTNRQFTGFVEEGTVHVYTRTSVGWSLAHQMTESVLQLGLGGLTVAIDDDTLAAAANGTLLVFRRDGAAWQEEARLRNASAGLAPDDDGLGAPVLRGDLLLARGLVWDEATERAISGLAVFTRSGTDWTLQSHRTLPNPRASNFISDHDIGDTDVVVGAHFGLAAYTFALRSAPPAPPPSADLVLKKQQHVFRCGKVALARYTLTIGNLGPDRAAAVEVRDQLPAGALFLCAQASRGTLKTPRQWHQGTLIWKPGELVAEPQAAASLTIWALINRDGTHVNRARIESSTTDPNPANNRDSTSYIVRFPSLQVPPED